MEKYIPYAEHLWLETVRGTSWNCDMVNKL